MSIIVALIKNSEKKSFYTRIFIELYVYDIINKFN